jgi:hypothetical protein
MFRPHLTWQHGGKCPAAKVWSSSVRCQLRLVVHQPIGLASMSRNARGNATEHAKPRPADEAVADCFVWAVNFGPLASVIVTDHNDD